MRQHEEAFALVRERGEIRSSAIAELLGCTPANVHELLLPYVARGELVSCDVDAGGERLKDYRVAAAAGGRAKEFRPYSSTPAQKKPPSFPAPAARQPEPQKEDTPMSISDKCEAAFRKHGPMTTRALREYVKDTSASAIVGQCAKAGRFAVLGGKKFNLIYGLPDQEAPPAKAGKDTPPRSIHKGHAGGGKRSMRKAGKKRRIARTSRIPLPALVAAGRFRPSIACDGAILLTGAAAPGELNSAEARVLAEFLLRMNGAGVAA